MTPRNILLALMVCLPVAGLGAPVEPAPGFRVPPGFEVVEVASDALAHDIYTLTITPRGDLLVAGRGYIRKLVDDDGDGRFDRALELSPTPRDGAMGLLVEGDTLWCMGDGGLRRFRYHGDDQPLGASTLVLPLKTGGEHDAHAILRGPDGWLYLLLGNSTGIASKHATSPQSPIREPIAGVVLRLAPDFKQSEIVADGFRNPYGFDFNLDGELFTYDSDNERCVGLPWYEGTRFYHVIPGGHFGWQSPQRAQTWRMPPWFPDVVPPILDMGRGSPTGVVCYRHHQFPERYHGGMFLGDWTFGRIDFIRLTRRGESYVGTAERFLESVGDHGFAPTGLALHPVTGDLYVTIGGRGTRGAVYRIRYPAGLEQARARSLMALPSKTLPPRIDPAQPLPPARKDEPPLVALRRLQRQLGDIGAPAAQGTVFEGYTPRRPGRVEPSVLDAWQNRFPTGDRRVDGEIGRTLALAGFADASFRARWLAEANPNSDPVEDLHRLIVFARLPGPRTQEQTRSVAKLLLDLDRKFTERKWNRDRNWPPRVSELHVELARQDPALNQALLADSLFERPGNVLFTRAPNFPRDAAAERYLKASDHAADFAWNAELVALVGRLPDARIRPLLQRLLERGGLDDAIVPVLARHPRVEDRPRFLAALRSPQLSLASRALEALARLPGEADADERLALVRVMRALGETKAELALRDQVVRRLETVSGEKLGPNRQAWTEWLTRTQPDVVARLNQQDGVDVVAWQKRLARVDWNRGDARRGQDVFQRASCSSCHSGGQALGPDLKGVTSRFSRDDLFTAILQPSKDISSRYRTVQIATIDGKVYQGLVIYEAVDGVILQTGPAETVRIGSTIESRGFSEVSLMPAGLLDKLDDREIADLFAYLKSLR